MTAIQLKQIADLVNQNRPEFLKKEAETTISLIDEGLQRSAHKGKYQKIEYVRAEEIEFILPYLETLKTTGFKVVSVQKNDQVTLTISWDAKQ